MKRDLYNNVKTVTALAPKLQTSTVSGAVIDLRGFNSCDFIVHAGVVSDGAYPIGLYECSTSTGTFTAVASDDILGSTPTLTTGTASGTVAEFGYRGGKEFVQVVGVASGATSGATYGVTCVKGDPLTKGTRTY